MVVLVAHMKPTQTIFSDCLVRFQGRASSLLNLLDATIVWILFFCYRHLENWSHIRNPILFRFRTDLVDTFVELYKIGNKHSAILPFQQFPLLICNDLNFGNNKHWLQRIDLIQKLCRPSSLSSLDYPSITGSPNLCLIH